MTRLAPALTLAAALSVTGCAALASLFTASAPAIGQGLAAYEKAVEAARAGPLPVPLPALPASDPTVLAALCAARTVAVVQADVERATPPPAAPAPVDVASLVAAMDRQAVALATFTRALSEVPAARRKRAMAASGDAGAPPAAVERVDAGMGDAGAEGGA